jgi:Uncharacterized conserved protein
MRKALVVVLFLGVLCLADCSQTPAAQSSEYPTRTTLPTQTVTLTLTKTPLPTDTAEPTTIPEPQIGSIKISQADGMKMLYIPAGKFLMGDSYEQTIKDCQSSCFGGCTGCDVSAQMFYFDEVPQHSVNLSAYWIDITEVTNGMYGKCVADGHCSEPTNKSSMTRDSYYDNSSYENYPVIYVNWYQANTFCEWAGEKLPSEAQWEKAARGTDGRTFPWGNLGLVNDPRIISSETTTVGSDVESGASPYGVLDMSTNVSEWTADYYDDNYYPTSPINNPTGPIIGSLRTIRGAANYGWKNDRRTVSRYGSKPTLSFAFVGFRCILPIN